MRLFLAVNPGEHLRSELVTRIDQARGKIGSGGALRWTRPESWHLTLQFLGDWPDDRLTRLQQGIMGLEAGHGFLLKPGVLGAFPDLHRPRVLFLHLDSDGKAESLARSVRETVAEVWPRGPQDNKVFRAHLTVARVRGILTASERKILTGLDLDGLPDSEVREFHLVASVPHPTGPEYHTVMVVPLGRA